MSNNSVNIANLRYFTWGMLVCLLVSLTGCERFLEEPVSKTTSLVVTTTVQLDALLNNLSQFYTETNRTAIYSTDDFGLTTEIFDARPITFPMAAIEFALWDIEFLPDDGRENFWSNEYRKIFYANLVLEYLDQVSGSDQDKARLKADAHFIRAYSYWVLVNTYALPFTEANADEHGLPLKTGTSFEQPFERQSLSRTYALIESDLAEAMKTPLSLVQDGVARHWRANKAAVHGFAARYYLHRNNYTEALRHADLALEDHSSLIDYNTDMRYGQDGSVNINPGTPAAETVIIKYPYTHDNQVDLTDRIRWKEMLYFRNLFHESSWYLPSRELLALYDAENDLRYQYHYVENYSYDRGLTNPAYSWPGYVFFYKQYIPSGPTVAEVLLTKAESLARENEVAAALATVNTLRAKRIKPGPWVALSAATQAEAIQVILQERRRELPFSHRWYDIRRFNHNEDPNDDVVLSKVFYPYTISNVTQSAPVRSYSLSPHSRRFAVPIPRTEIISSQGRIEQNTY